MAPILIPNYPVFGTLDVGPEGEVYTVGANDSGSAALWLSRSTNAASVSEPMAFGLTTAVNLGGSVVAGSVGYSDRINYDGWLGRPWIAVDRSTSPRRGNVYALCTVTNDPGNFVNVMFSRSTDGGATWSVPMRINDDSPTQHAWHWFGTLSVAPNGRVDACWYDTRNDPTNQVPLSQLYYSWSEDGGRTWAPNRPLSPPFDTSLGYPNQEKIGDYITMVSLNENACIAYAATFNGEEDIYFVRAELPIRVTATLLPDAVHLSWNGVPGATYSVQANADPSPWSAPVSVGFVTPTGSVGTLDDPLTAGIQTRFYRVVREP